MATFLSYSTDDPNIPAGVNPALAGGGVAIVGPIAPGVASTVAGSVFADVAGTCEVQQCFDYWLQANQLNPTPHFDVVDSISVSAGTPSKIHLDVIAPVLRVVYTNGATTQTHFRLYVRVFGVKGGG